MKKILLSILLLFVFSPITFADENLNNVFKIYSYDYDKINEGFYYYSQGSAVLINSDTVLTNAHVVLNEDNEVLGNYELCKTNNFKKSPECFTTGDLLYYDISKDLAYLKLNKKVESKGVELSDKELEIGDNVTTYGYPANGGGTISFTTGKISGFDLGKYKIDADIDSGSSGGAAFDENDKLIGITSSVVVGYTTSGRVISVEDIKNFLNKSGEITDYEGGITSMFQSYHDYLSSFIGKSSVNNKYFTLKDIHKNKFNIFDVNVSNDRNIFMFQLESNSGDTTIDIKKNIGTPNEVNYDLLFARLKKKLGNTQDYKFVFKKLKLKGKSVYVVLKIDKKSKDLEIVFTSQGISFNIEGTLNNSQELNSALILYFKKFNILSDNTKYFKDSITVGGFTFNKHENIDYSYGFLNENNYYSVLGFININETIGLIQPQNYSFELKDLEEDATMESMVQYLIEYYDEYEEYKVFDSGVLKNSNGKIFGYIAVTSPHEEIVTYSVFSYNTYKDTNHYSYFLLAFDSYDKDIQKGVKTFIDTLTYEGDSVVPVKDKYKIKSTRHIK